MGKKIITFSNIDVEKHNFQQHKTPISTHDVNIDRIIVSKKVPIGIKGFKYFIGCKINYKKVKPLCIRHPK